MSTMWKSDFDVVYGVSMQIISTVTSWAGGDELEGVGIIGEPHLTNILTHLIPRDAFPRKKTAWDLQIWTVEVGKRRMGGRGKGGHSKIPSHS